MKTETIFTFLPIVDSKNIDVSLLNDQASIPLLFTINSESETAVGITQPFKDSFNDAVSANDLEKLSDLKDAQPRQYNAALLLFANEYSRQFGIEAMKVDKEDRPAKRKELRDNFKMAISLLPGARSYFAAILNCKVDTVLPKVSEFFDKHNNAFTGGVPDPAGSGREIQAEVVAFNELSEVDFQGIYDELAKNIDIVRHLAYWKGVVSGIVIEDQKLWTSAGVAKQAAGFGLMNKETRQNDPFFRQNVLSNARLVGFINAVSVKQ